jgi:hypothetical protein
VPAHLRCRYPSKDRLDHVVPRMKRLLISSVAPSVIWAGIALGVAAGLEIPTAPRYSERPR